MRKSSNSKNNGLKHNQFDLLIKTLIAMMDVKNITVFLRALLTESERAVIEQRLDVMRMLVLGNNYEEIKKITGVSTATIINAAKLLKRSNKKLRQTLLTWKPASERGFGDNSNQGFESSGYFQAIHPGAIRRVPKKK